jgi:hypothetical protein
VTNDDRNETLKDLHFNPDEQRIIKDLKRKVESAVPYSVLDNPFMVVAGGCFTSWLWDEKPKDIDIFVLGDPTSPGTQEQVHRNNRSFINANFANVEDKTDTYRRDNEKVLEVYDSKPYQFIFTTHESRKALVEDFDFKHCMVSMWRHQLYITRSTYKAIFNKELIPQNTKRIAQWREEKFLAKGFTKQYTTAPTVPWTIKQAGGVLDIVDARHPSYLDAVANGSIDAYRNPYMKGYVEEMLKKQMKALAIDWEDLTK